MKNLNRFKSKLIKSLDYFNDLFYPYLPPQLPTQEMIDKMPSLDELEAQVYQDTLNRINPDGIYHYRCHPQPMAEKGECIPDLGDMLLHQGILLGAIAMRIKHIGEGGITYKTFDALLRGMEHFIEDGYLLRGKCRHTKEFVFGSLYRQWHQGKWQYASDLGHPPVSGDQLAGLCFGLSLAYLLHPERFSDSLKQKILSFTDRMMDNKMMLQQRNGKTCKGEIPYDSIREFNGSVVTKLALLSLAYRIKYEDNHSDWVKYYDKYFKLKIDYSFDSLAEYSSIFIGSWNNWFGTNIAALSLFAIGLNMDFPKYVKRGLRRIAHQTRDYGYGIFNLLYWLSINSRGSKDYITKCLCSHFIPYGEDKFARSIFFFGRKKRISALSIRARCKEDFVFQRNAFDPANNFNPDLWALDNTGSEDFIIEYWLAKYLGVI